MNVSEVLEWIQTEYTKSFWSSKSELFFENRNRPVIAYEKAQTKIPDDVTQCPFPEEKNERIKKEQGNYRWFLPDAPDVTDDQGTHEF